MQNSLPAPETLPKVLPRWHYIGNYGTGDLPGGRVCALHGTEMSLLFRERRFREEGKIGAFRSSQISILLLCAGNVMPGARSHRLESCCISSKTASFHNQIPWTWWQMPDQLGWPWCPALQRLPKQARHGATLTLANRYLETSYRWPCRSQLPPHSAPHFTASLMGSGRLVGPEQKP